MITYASCQKASSSFSEKYFCKVLKFLKMEKTGAFKKSQAQTNSGFEM